MPSKKAVAKKATKKEVAPKPVKAKKEKGVVNVEAKVRFVSFSIRAVIPTQQFGNIQPEITVEAPTFEEARAFVMPHIEDLYRHFCETKPVFLGRVVETEKVVAPVAVEGSAAAPAPKVQEGSSSSAPAPEAAPTPAPTATDPVQPETQKPEAVLKAEKAIRLAATDEALKAIQDQIERSTKIDAADKPALITMVLAARSKFK